MGHTKASSYEAGVGPVFDSTLYAFDEVITLGGWLDQSADVIHLYVNDRDNVVSTVSARGGWSELGVGYYLSPDTPSTIQADVLEVRVQYVGDGLETTAGSQGSWLTYDDFTGDSLDTERWSPAGIVTPEFTGEVLRLSATQAEGGGAEYTYAIDLDPSHLRQEYDCSEFTGLEASVRPSTAQRYGNVLLQGGTPGNLILYFGGVDPLAQSPPPYAVARSGERLFGRSRSLSSNRFHRLRIEWQEDRVQFFVDDELIELDETVANPGYPGFLKLGFSAEKGDIEAEVDQVRIRCVKE
jgi:hypothetical protein